MLRFTPSRRDQECEGKKGWETRKGAKAEAKRLSNQVGYQMQFYTCPWCSMWHVGSAPGSPIRSTTYPKTKERKG